MSLIPIDISMITNGQQSSADVLNAAFLGLQAQGATILDLLSNIQLTTLLDYDHSLTALQSKQQRAARVQAADIVGLFAISDFASIDQGSTTATVRIDTTSATLRERRFPNTALVSSTAFQVTSGSVSALNKYQTLLSVLSAGSIPTGTFTMQLQESVELSVMTLSLSAMASSPVVVVQVSSDGLVYTPADTTSLNGGTLNAWFTKQAVQYIQVILTPSHPDNLGGDLYTFGVTGFTASTVSYNLISDIVFRPVTLQPQSSALIFHAQGTGSIIYNLLLTAGNAPGSYIAVIDGSEIAIPTAVDHSFSGCALSSSGQILAPSLETDFYGTTMEVIDEATGLAIPVLFGLSPTDPNIASLSQVYCCFNPENEAYLVLSPLPASLAGTYTVKYTSGPASVTALLLVHLSTTDRTQTPVFRAASLEE